MSAEETERHLEDAPRVRDRTRVIRRAEPLRPTTDPLRGALREAEHRFLGLQSSGRASTEVFSEYLTILSEIRFIDESLEEASSRRDIPYIVDRRLSFLNDHCRWLTRRVTGEILLIVQVRLEQELKRVITPDAYQMFLRLEEVEDAAREIETLGDGELMAKLRDGTLVREVLEQVRLSDVVGQAPRMAPLVEPSG